MTPRRALAEAVLARHTELMGQTSGAPKGVCASCGYDVRGPNGWPCDAHQAAQALLAAQALQAAQALLAAEARVAALTRYWDAEWDIRLHEDESVMIDAASARVDEWHASVAAVQAAGVSVRAALAPEPSEEVET